MEIELINEKLTIELYKVMKCSLNIGAEEQFVLEPWFLYSNTRLIKTISSMISQRCDQPFDIIGIASSWGRPFGTLLAYHLSILRDSWYHIIEVESDLPDSIYDLKNKRVFVIDDAIKTGDTFLETMDKLSNVGAKLAYYLVIIDHRKYIREELAKRKMAEYPGQILALVQVQ